MEISTEDKILDVAQRHFVVKGYAGAKMQDIADEAEINKALLHYYFRSKDKLFKEELHRTFDQFFPEVLKAFQSDGDILQKLENIVSTYINLLIKMPHVPFFITYELHQNRDSFVTNMMQRTNIMHALKGFIESFEQSIKEGMIKPYPPQQLLLNTLSLTVFPFIARTIFTNVFQIEEPAFLLLMEERKSVIMDFLESSLKP